MSLYMTQFAYTTEAWAALVKNPQDRSVALKAGIEKLGGRMLNFYYCFGEYDGVVISEAPDEVTVTSAVLAVVVAGHIKAIKTTVLLSVEDAMKAMSKAGAVVYAAPKG
jgi:uncharacterized protein with GYD domain